MEKRTKKEVWKVVDMSKMIDEFVDICDKGNNDIKDFVKNKSVDKKIELRACLQEKIEHLSGKVSIILFEGSICVAILTNITLWFSVALVLIVVWACILQCQKAKYAKALSYLDDYWNEGKQQELHKDFPKLEMETFEQMRDRFVKDIDKKVSTLNKKRIEIDEEISRCDEFRNTLYNFEEHD